MYYCVSTVQYLGESTHHLQCVWMVAVTVTLELSSVNRIMGMMMRRIRCQLGMQTVNSSRRTHTVTTVGSPVPPFHEVWVQ